MPVSKGGLKPHGLRYREAADPAAFLYDVAGDVLNLVNSVTFKDETEGAACG